MLPILSAAEWLEATALSTAFRESVWVYPIVQSIHVLGLALFLGLTVVMDLRLVGALLRQTPVGQVMAALLPWIRWGFALMAVTGFVLLASTPVTYVTNVFMLGKFALLGVAGLNVWVFHSTAYPTVGDWGAAARPPWRARLAGASSLTFWALIVLTGRFVAYNWFS
jgi:hypothetical protein